MTLLLLITGLVLLLAGGTALVTGASGLASRLGVSPLLIGMTVVGFGTSSPELVVNVLGALEGHTDLAFGNVLGSNIANLGLILGLAALICPVAIAGQLVRREVPLLLLITCVLAVMLLDGPLAGLPAMLNRADAVILLLLLAMFLYMSTQDIFQQQEDVLVQGASRIEEHIEEHLLPSSGRYWLMTLGGIAVLCLGGQLTISHGTALAAALGVSETIIGLFVVAIGTSLPELATSVIAAMRRQSDLCVGNVVGSNLFNVLFILPITALISPFPIPEGGITDVIVSLLLAAAILPIFLLGKAGMGRLTGLAFLVSYVGYLAYRTQV